MHGIAGAGPATTPAVLKAMGIAPAASWRGADHDLTTRAFTYLPLDVACPSLMRLFDLRSVLGVRSPANSFCRDLNPCSAPARIQGVFHPSYLPIHLETTLLLGQRRAAIFKGGGGEAQCNPEKPVRVVSAIG
jgi:anthranilate phosphoribosyltransferase